MKDRINTANYSALTRTQDRLAYLRSLAIGTLISEAVDVFIANEKSILTGTFEDSLLDHSKYKAQIDDIIAESIQKIYQSSEVVDKEIAGYNILSTLLDGFTTACEHHYEGQATHYDSLLLKSLDTPLPVEASVYEYTMLCCSHISMLTDGNALQLFQKIKGHL